MNHKEVRNTVFQFTGGVTSTPGGASPNPYNGVADYLLGLPQTTNVWFQPQQPYITLREYDFSVYARDQWQASHKLTINYGLRWEYFPVPTTATRGIQYDNLFTDINNPTMELCGVGGNPGDCGITVSKKLFAPSLGIAYRVDDNTVVRAGYALSPTQVEMGNSGTQAYPATVEGVYNGTNSYLPASTTLATGFPTIPNPVPDSSWECCHSLRSRQRQHCGEELHSRLHPILELECAAGFRWVRRASRLCGNPRGSPEWNRQL